MKLKIIYAEMSAANDEVELEHNEHVAGILESRGLPDGSYHVTLLIEAR